MFEVCADSNDDYIHLKLSGKLTHEDYVETLIPAIKEQVEISLLVEASDFDGWTWQAAWDDLNVGIKHRHNFVKIAVLGLPAWVENLSKLFTFMFDGEYKCFNADELSIAKEWLIAE